MNPNLRKALQELVIILQSTGITMHEAETAFKKEWLENQLWQHGGNYCRTARSMGTHRNTLSRTVQQLGIDVSAIRQASR